MSRELQNNFTQVVGRQAYPTIDMHAYIQDGGICINNSVTFWTLLLKIIIILIKNKFILFPYCNAVERDFSPKWLV
jgi:hypothetical protein